MVTTRLICVLIGLLPVLLIVKPVHRIGSNKERVVKMSEVYEYEFSSNCRCTKFDPETDTDVVDEQGYPVPSEECFGCWQDDKGNIDEILLLPYLKDNNIDADDSLVIAGSNIGWRHLSGYTICKATIDDVIERLSINGDFTLRFKFDRDANELSVSRSSHDEPTGTGKLVFRLATAEEVTDWLLHR